MKKNSMRKLMVTAMTAIISTSLLVGCASSVKTGTTEGEKKGGTIMWLSNLSSGSQYEATVAYAESITNELGYKFKVIYGDSFNDPSGNLNAVKNAMTNDVVGLIASQDGGIQNIMEEYPELYVTGYLNDMASVYGEGGTSAAAANNEKFLGTVADGYVSGVGLGKLYAENVINNGYKKVSIINFPVYAYPQQAIAAETFRSEINAYNSTASEKIEIVGDNKTLEFSPLDNSYFLEKEYQNLDVIVGLCAGVDFIYPTMKAAIDAGTINKNMKLLTAGFNEDDSIVADIGGEGIIQCIAISPTENILFALAMIDNALNGKQYADFTKSENLDSIPYVIDSKEDIDNVMSKSLLGTKKTSDAQISLDEFKNVLTRYNEKATYEDLKTLLQSEQLLVDSLGK